MTIIKCDQQIVSDCAAIHSAGLGGYMFKWQLISQTTLDIGVQCRSLITHWQF